MDRKKILYPECLSGSLFCYPCVANCLFRVPKSLVIMLLFYFRSVEWHGITSYVVQCSEFSDAGKFFAESFDNDHFRRKQNLNCTFPNNKTTLKVVNK